MQDRYAGDIGDYGKIGLLKAIRSTGLSIGVNWYQTSPLEMEKNGDGTYKQDDGKYFIPEQLRICDEALAQTLIGISSGKDRTVKALERADLIQGAVYYHEPVPIEKRKEWHKEALGKLKDANLVFLDPDNGMLVKSIGKRAGKSVKYTFYEEVRDYWERGQSVLIYNHRCRKQESIYFREICEKFHEYAGIGGNQILKITFPKCSVRDYLAVCATEEHRGKVGRAFAEMEGGIWGKTGMCRIPRASYWPRNGQ